MLRKNLPNLLTITNLTFGMLSILVVASADHTNLVNHGNDVNLIYYSCLFVMIAALTDRFDGKLARHLGVASELGKQLDSLSDLVSFGVAPALIAWKLGHISAFLLLPLGEPLAYLIAVIFPVAGAIRLAKYNLQSDPAVFRGIPITLAGSILTLLNLFNTFMFLKDRFTLVNLIGSMVMMVVLSLLMVSKIPIRKI